MGQKKPQNFFGGVKKTRWGKKTTIFKANYAYYTLNYAIY